MLSLDGYQAARERSVVADRSGRGTIVITGGDRISLLHNLLTNDIADLGPGRGCYSAYLTPQGRMIADMRVVVRDDRVLLDVEPSVTRDLLERLDLSIFAEDVQVADLDRIDLDPSRGRSCLCRDHRGGFRQPLPRSSACPR